MINELTIVMYHYVRPINGSNFPNIKGLEFSAFKRQLDYLQHNFEIIDINNIVNFIKNNDMLPPKACLLTFDDGYSDHYKYVFPELIKRKIKGMFFPSSLTVMENKILYVNKIQFILAVINNTKTLYTDFKQECYNNGIKDSFLKSTWVKYGTKSDYDNEKVTYIKRMLQYVLEENIRKKIIDTLFKKYVSIDEKNFSKELYLSENEAKEMVNNGMYFGNHGYEHLWLENASHEKQLFEINKSLTFLKEIGAPTKGWVMCYPFGSYNQETLSILKSKNCLIGLTTVHGKAFLNNKNLLELPRFDTNDFPQ